LRESQAHDVELSQARVDLGRARVLVADLGKAERNAERRLGVAVHQCRLLVPQELGPVPIEPECAFSFDLAEPDCVDLGLVPDFPRCREDAVQLAKRQRLEVRLMIVGLRIARLQQVRDKARLFGLGQLPLGMSFKNTTTANGGIALGLIFGSLYDLPVVNVSYWANIRQARLDIIRSQLDLEKSLLEVAEDAGSSWDRWQQAVREWEQREAEYRLRIEYRDRRARLYREYQVIRLDVLASEVDLLQADANRWTAWYNLQLARLDILRATELLLDYIEKAGIAAVPAVVDTPAKPDHGHGFLQRIVHLGKLDARDQKEVQ
jgi:outer membrane protein TolC